MVFLSIHSEPFARGRDEAHVALQRARLMDIAAQAAAVRGAGMRLIVAAPLEATREPRLAGEHARRVPPARTADITPDEEGFEYLPLPAGEATRRVFGAGETRQILRNAIAAADIVEVRGGGGLSRLAWTLAGEAGRKRICTIDTERAEQIEPDRPRLTEADLGFIETIDGSAAAGLRPHVHTFARPMITESMVLSPAMLERRVELLQPAQPLRLASAGTQTVLAGTEQIINAIRRLARLSVKIQLDVIGEGKDLPLLRDATRDAKLEQQVQFLGELSGGELAEVWSTCHALVIAKLDAGVAAHFAAGLARGMPIIAYSGPSAYARAAEKGAAMLVPKGDIDHLADAMLKLHSDRARVAAMARSAAEYARELTLDAMHRRRAQLARDVLNPALAGAMR